MSQYGVLQAVFMAFFSKKLYRDVANNWGGKAWLYLLLILAFSWIFASIQFQQAVNEGYDKYSALLVDQIPLLVIQNGVVSTPENRPYVITDPQTRETMAIIDTSGQYTDISTTATPLLITQTEIITKPKSNEIRTNKIPNNVSLLIKPKSISAFLEVIVGYTGLIFFILFLCNSYLYRLIQVHLYAILGKIFGALTGTYLFYPQILQIAMVALTPIIVISSVLDYMELNIPHQWILYSLLTVAYILFGVHANKRTEPKT